MATRTWCPCFSKLDIRRDVVPRTIESSIMTTRCSLQHQKRQSSSISWSRTWVAWRRSAAWLVFDETYLLGKPWFFPQSLLAALSGSLLPTHTSLRKLKLTCWAPILHESELSACGCWSCDGKVYLLNRLPAEYRLYSCHTGCHYHQ